ncbi:hypothetical protein SDC9_148967 [bioreactor metagenome]|uniref:Uncharacterized protein n=1 Tax=bioreactor metagenome TaxID=1076179 RepID=A0A645EIC2_9ZZZZ
MSIDQVTGAYRVILLGQQEAAAAVESQFFQQRTAQLGNAVDPGKRNFCFGQSLQPGLEMARVGQCRQEQLLVFALGFLVAKRGGGGQGGALEVLADLAGNQGLPVRSVQKRNAFVGMSFLGNVGQQRETPPIVRGEVLREQVQAVVVVLEDALGQQVALLPGKGRKTVRIEIEESGLHVLILLITS